MLNFLNFFRKKWTFSKIKQTDLLILSQDIFLFNKKIKFAYYDDKIYLRYILDILIYFLSQKIKKKKISIIEAHTFIKIKKTNSCIALGHDRNKLIFDVKKYFPEIKNIAYQFGYWFPNLIDKGLELVKNKKIDYYFFFDERTKQLTEKFMKTNSIISGSIPSNEKIFPVIKKKYDFMFISNFRYSTETEAKNLNASQAFFLDNLSKYCNLKNKSFCIARVYTRKDKNRYSNKNLKQENIFIKKYAKNYFVENIDSFILAQKSEVCICTHSNLGYELLGRGNKVLFCNTNKDTYSWHFASVANGPFWYKGNSKKEIFEKLENILSLSNNSWNKILRDSKIPIKFDPGNKILKSIIYKLKYN